MGEQGDEIKQLRRQLADLKAQMAVAQHQGCWLSQNPNGYHDSLFQNIQEGIVLAGPQGRLTMVNPAGLAMLGCTKNDILKMSLDSLFADDADYQAFTAQMESQGYVEELEFKLRSAGEKVRDIVMCAERQRDSQGSHAGYQCILRDVTEQKSHARQRSQAAEQLEESNRQLEEMIEHANRMSVQAEVTNIELNLIFNAASEGMCVIGRDGKVLRINEPFAAISGVDKDAAVGKTCGELFNNSLCNSDACPLKVIKKTKERVQEEFEYVDENGQVHNYVLSANPFFGLAGELVGIVENYRDVTEQKKLENSLREMATTDGLTGVFNRRHYLSLSEKDCRRVRRYGFPLSLIMFDIDHFKKVNDTYGHAAGDQVLIETCNIAQQQLRDSDILGRIGGEEFAITLVECDQDQALRVAERLRKAFAKGGVESSCGEVRFTVSLGVAQVAPGEDLASLMRRADAALYEAKETGRNRVCLAKPPESISSEGVCEARPEL